MCSSARDSVSSYSLSAWKMVDTAATKSRVVWRLGCEVRLQLDFIGDYESNNLFR